MNPGRILAEARRLLLRRRTARLVLGFLVFFGLLAFLGLEEEGMDLPIGIGYYTAPLLLCPYAAHLVVAGRDGGVVEVSATTPLTRGEALAGKILTAAIFPLIAVAATLPVLYGLAIPVAPGAFWSLLEHVPWAILLSWAAASWGLLVGSLTPDHPRLGLVLAFGLAVVWFVAGVNLNDIVDPGPLVTFLMKASPYSYVDSASPIAPLPSAPASFLVGPLILAGTALAALVPLAGRLQHATGWRTPVAGQPLAVFALAATLVVGATALVAWELPENPWGTQDLGQPVEGIQAGIDWGVTLFPHEEDAMPPRVPWSPDTPMRLRITATGSPNATISIAEFALASEKIRFQLLEPIPDTIVLDGILERDGQTVGVGSVEGRWMAHPRELFQTEHVEITFEADGEPVAFEVGQGALRWQLQASSIAAGAVVALVPAMAAARWLPRRWNRW